MIASARGGGPGALSRGVLPQPAGIGIGISLASLRRFWAVAARWNSSRAPFGPRNRSRRFFRPKVVAPSSHETEQQGEDDRSQCAQNGLYHGAAKPPGLRRPHRPRGGADERHPG